MTWIWEEIKRDWIGNCYTDLDPSIVTLNFNHVENVLGHEWINHFREIHPGYSSYTVVSIMALGEELSSLQGINGNEKLLNRIKSNNVSALSELRVIHILKTGFDNIIIEIEPEVRVGNRVKRPDLRVRWNDSPWIYVEVTRPDLSEKGKRLTDILQRISSIINAKTGSFALDVYLAEEPNDVQLEIIISEATKLMSKTGTKEVLVEGIACLTLNPIEERSTSLEKENPEIPKLLVTSTTIGNSASQRITARTPYLDKRIDRLLENEAKQLPKGSPNLIILDASQIIGRLHLWDNIILRRFQPNINTRISGVCLLQTFLLLGGPRGFVSKHSLTRLLLNSYAALNLPAWVKTQLDRYKKDPLKPEDG